MAVRLVLILCVVVVVAVRATVAVMDESAAIGAVTYTHEDVVLEARQSELFQKWLRRFPREYSSSESERSYRFQVFKDNLQFIHAHNQNSGASYRLGLNRFADISHDEFHERFLNAWFNVTERFFPLLDAGGTFTYANSYIPDSVDWRPKGVLARVKDQGVCGSCWAHAVVAAVESINKIVTGNMIELSEQQLMDCNTANGFVSGCGGGALPTAYNYIIQNGGIDSESDYPYMGRGGWCSYNKRNVVSINGYGRVPQNDESSLMKTLANQPASVGLSASREFQLYSQGVFSGPCAPTKNHAALIVGYGRDSASGLNYWIMKNSYGTDWGEAGFMRIRRSPSVCQMLEDVGYPIKN